MATLRSLLTLMPIGIALAAQSTCPDGKRPGSIGSGSTMFPICCPGAFAVMDEGSTTAISCTYGCGPLIKTVCASTTRTSTATSPSTLPASATTPTIAAAAAATTTTCSGNACAPPSGCSLVTESSSSTGVCTIADFSQPGYLQQVYGSLAGSGTFGGPPSTAAAARITDAPQVMAVAGALVGLALW